MSINEITGCILINNEFSVDEFDVCLYHANCPDGIGAAYPFWKANRYRSEKFILHGVKHNEPYPSDLIRRKRVVIVDFCYPREIIANMCEEAEYILILDHHDTAQRELIDQKHQRLSYIFDMSRSGAQIAWNYCYPEILCPWFIEIIADRDLWKWAIPFSKEIGKALHSGGWYTWEKMLELEESKDPIGDQMKFFKQGQILLSVEAKEIDYAIQSSVIVEFCGYRIRMTTCNPNIRSEVGNQLANMNDCKFSAIWRYDFISDQWWISLRGSANCQIPLNKICEIYSGGGHQKACGFAIHGSRSTEWKNANTTTRMKLAHGILHDYFKPIDSA